MTGFPQATDGPIPGGKVRMSSLIKLSVGDKVLYRDEVVTIVHIELVPNCNQCTSLVCQVFASTEHDSFVCATSDKFRPIPNEAYEEFYPSVKLNDLGRMVPCRMVPLSDGPKKDVLFRGA